MDIKLIQKRINNIELIKKDFERAHGEEDELLWDFVRFVANSNQQYAELAKEILKLENISFPRYCA